MQKGPFGGNSEEFLGATDIHPRVFLKDQHQSGFFVLRDVEGKINTSINVFIQHYKKMRLRYPNLRLEHLDGGRDSSFRGHRTNYARFSKLFDEERDPRAGTVSHYLSWSLWSFANPLVSIEVVDGEEITSATGTVDSPCSTAQVSLCALPI